jgi:mono/diheme cytochrome c family protein
MKTYPRIGSSYLLATFATVVSLLTALPSPAQNAPTGNAQKGSQAFVSHTCSTCHGAQGEGRAISSSLVAPQIAPPGRLYSDFVRLVRQPAGAMPPFSAQAVSDSDLADIYAFLQSANPAPPSHLSALTGNIQNGSRMFSSDGCYECHGGVGQGAQQTAAPRIGPPALTIDAFARYIHAPTGNMPPYTTKVVSDQDIADIYAFLKAVPPVRQAKDIPLLNQ